MPIQRGQLCKQSYMPNDDVITIERFNPYYFVIIRDLNCRTVYQSIGYKTFVAAERDFDHKLRHV